LEDKIGRSIVSKRQSMSEIPNLFLTFQQDEQPGTAPLFDQFLMIGASPRRPCPDPIVLMAYPGSNMFLTPQEILTIPLFCFPCKFQKIANEKFLQQFVFEIGASSNPFRIYGVCVVTSFSRCRNIWFASDESKQYPICFCFLTRNPMIATSLHILYFFTRFFMGDVSSPVSHRFEGEYPDVPRGEVLPGNVVQGPAQKAPGVEITATFLRELAYFARLTPRDRPRSITLTRQSRMVIPSQGQAPKCVYYMGLDILFSSLSIDHLMTVLSVFMLEKHMVLISEDIHRLTLSVLCLQELIRPLTWQGTFVPVLPDRDDYLGMLESPVPYVIGLIKTGTQPPVPDYATVVDLDLDQVIEPDRTPPLNSWMERHCLWILGTASDFERCRPPSAPSRRMPRHAALDGPWPDEHSSCATARLH
jgi:hypothetical protein